MEKRLQNVFVIQQEHKKVLFYHPNDIELNTKIKDVGLSEAIITFTG